MSPVTITLLIILAILIIVFIVLYFLSKRAMKKQEEQNEIIERTAQSVSILIIDKKKLRISQSGLPEEVIAQTPKYLRFSKVPIVKAKVGPRMVTLMCDPTIYDSIPVKKEVKASISGIYISSVRGLHGKQEAPEEKKGFFKRLFNR